jgi:hypothetical protein
VVGYNAAGRLIGFREECHEVIAIFADHVNHPETAEHGASVRALLDAHIADGKGNAQ